MDYTPTILYASLGGYAGSVLNAYGALKANDGIKYWMRIGGDTTGGGVGGALCAVDQKLQIEYNGQSGSTNMLSGGDSWWAGGTVLCRLGSGNSTTEAGRYPLHIEPRDNTKNGLGFGQPIFTYQATQTSDLLPINSQPAAGGGLPVSTKSIGFGVTIRPVITSVSQSSVGMGGGALLEIKGAGFSTLGHNEVRIGDVPCEIVTYEMNRITCLTGATATASATTVAPNVLHPGGAGLFQQVYMQMASRTTDQNEQFITYRDYYSNWIYWNAVKGKTKKWVEQRVFPPGLTPAFAEVNGDSLTSRFGYYGSNVDENYLQEMTGFFIPPVSANYSFYTRGDDTVHLFLSATASPKNLTLIAMSRRWNYNWYTNDPANQISAKVYCKAGQPYYFRLVHTEFGYGDWYDVAIRVHSEKGKNAEVERVLGSDHQRAIRVTSNVQSVEIAADSGYFALRLTVAGVNITTTPLDLTTTTKDDITKAIVDATGGFYDTPFTDWAYHYGARCSLSPTDACTDGAYSDAGTAFLGQDPQVGYNSYDLWWFQPLALDYKQGSSGFRVGGDGGLVYNTVTKTAKFTMFFWGPASSSLKTVEVLRTTRTTSGTALGLISTDTSRPVKTATTVIQEGSTDPFYHPAPMDFFRTALPLTPITVTSNGLLSVCNHVLPVNVSSNATTLRYNVPGGKQYPETGWMSKFPNTTTAADLHGCAVVYDAALTPTLTSVTGVLARGNVVTVGGTRFLPPSAGGGLGPGETNLTVDQLNSILLVGTSGLALTSGVIIPCPVATATATQLTCTVPHLVAGGYSVKVVVGLGRGAAVDHRTPVPTTAPASAAARRLTADANPSDMCCYASGSDSATFLPATGEW